MIALTAFEVPLRVDADGVIRVGATRVTLDLVLDYFKQGIDAESIARKLPAITRTEVYGAITYYLQHQVEIEEYLRQGEEEAERIEQKWKNFLNGATPLEFCVSPNDSIPPRKRRPISRRRSKIAFPMSPEEASVWAKEWYTNRSRRKRLHTASYQRIRTNILKRQKGRCYYCGKKIVGTFHVDHAIPLSRGGSNAPENLVAACIKCNLQKGAKLPHEWPEGGRLL
jgi:uncharacterized protein (DUF433 family)